VAITDIAIEPALDDFRLRNEKACEGPLETECSVRITFDPRTVGVLQARMVISHDGPDSPEEIPISGTGVAPGGGPAIRFDPDSITFGPVPSGDTRIQEVTVINEGGADLEVSSKEIQITIGPPDVFTVVEDTCTEITIPPGGECLIAVRFDPASKGETQADLILQDNAAGRQHAVPIFGRTALPDLITAEPEVTDDAVLGRKDVRVPVAIRIVNQGDIAAGPFKVSVHVTVGTDQFSARFLALDTETVDPSYPYVFTTADLSAAEGENEVVIAGTVVLSRALQGTEVELFAKADSCAEEETLPEECRVPELNEMNNESVRLVIPLPGEETTVSPTTPPPDVD
jgi:hypothetical protein